MIGRALNLNRVQITPCPDGEVVSGTSVKTSVSEARLRWLTELIFQIGHSVGILECQRRPPGLQMPTLQVPSPSRLSCLACEAWTSCRMSGLIPSRICKTGGLPGIPGTILEHLEPEDLACSGTQMNAQFGHACHPIWNPFHIG